MIKLDLKDKKILYQLDLNSRQSFSQIGKVVKLPKNVVFYRINKLVENGVITRFYTVIDAFKLGYTSIRFYLTFQYTTPEIEQEIIEYFVKNKYTYWIASTEGRYNLVVIMYVKNMCDLAYFWKETLVKYRDYFQQQIFSVYLQLRHYRNSYLLEDYKKTDREKYEVIGCEHKIEIDETDFKILNLISTNARMPLVDIAENINSSSTVVSYRLKNLLKKGVIQGFRTEFDLTKLGYKQFKVDIDFKKYDQIDEVMKYIVANPHLYYITKTVGHADLEPSFRVKSIEQLHEIMKDIILRFPNAIKNYKYFYITQYHKLHYMPEE